MMIEEKFPLMTDDQLRSLNANVARLGTVGTDKQRVEADRLRPLVTSELETRASVKPARATPLARKRLSKQGK